MTFLSSFFGKPPELVRDQIKTAFAVGRFPYGVIDLSSPVERHDYIIHLAVKILDFFIIEKKPARRSVPLNESAGMKALRAYTSALKLG